MGSVNILNTLLILLMLITYFLENKGTLGSGDDSDTSSANNENSDDESDNYAPKTSHPFKPPNKMKDSKNSKSSGKSKKPGPENSDTSESPKKHGGMFSKIKKTCTGIAHSTEKLKKLSIGGKSSTPESSSEPSGRKSNKDLSRNYSDVGGPKPNKSFSRSRSEVGSSGTSGPPNMSGGIRNLASKKPLSKIDSKSKASFEESEDDSDNSGGAKPNKSFSRSRSEVGPSKSPNMPGARNLNIQKQPGGRIGSMGKESSDDSDDDDDNSGSKKPDSFKPSNKFNNPMPAGFLEKQKQTSTSRPSNMPGIKNLNSKGLPSKIGPNSNSSDDSDDSDDESKNFGGFQINKNLPRSHNNEGTFRPPNMSGRPPSVNSLGGLNQVGIGNSGVSGIPNRPSIGSSGVSGIPNRPSIGSSGVSGIPNRPSIGSSGVSGIPNRPNTWNPQTSATPEQRAPRNPQNSATPNQHSGAISNYGGPVNSDLGNQNLRGGPYNNYYNPGNYGGPIQPYPGYQNYYSGPYNYDAATQNPYGGFNNPSYNTINPQNFGQQGYSGSFSYDNSVNTVYKAPAESFECYELNMKALFCENDKVKHEACLQIGMKIYSSSIWYQERPGSCRQANVVVDQSTCKCTVLYCSREELGVSFFVTTDPRLEKVHILMEENSSSSVEGKMLVLKYDYSFNYNLLFLQDYVKK